MVVSELKTIVHDVGVIAGYAAQVISATDYSPFGVALEGRTYSSEGYRFNGKEKDSENFEGTYGFGARILDARLGRFLSIDPKTNNFPTFSSYLFAANSPIIAIDRNGESVYVVTSGGEFVEINNPKAVEIREKIGNSTFMKTTIGADMLKRLKGSQKIDVYISIDAFPPVKDADENTVPTTAQALTNFDPEPRVREKGEGISSNSPEIKSKNSRHIFQISINEDKMNSQDTYENGAVLYHEGMAHIMNAWEVQKAVSQEMGKTSSTDPDERKQIQEAGGRMSHVMYGSISYGYTGGIPRAGSPSAAIQKAMATLKASDELAKKAVPRIKNVSHKM